MANDSYTQQALAMDIHFRSRVKAQMSSIAWQVQNEDPATPNHDARNRYAHQVIRQLDSEVGVIMPSFVMRPNVFGFNTTYAFDFQLQVGQVVSATGDADIASQLASDWDKMAAGAGFVAPPPGGSTFSAEPASASSGVPLAPTTVPPPPPRSR